MTDRPIIFSAPMVRALLDGQKTQTRRLATSPLRRCEVGDRLWVRESAAAEELHLPPKTVPATARERRLTGRTTAVVVDDLDGSDGMRYLADEEWLPIASTREAGEAWSEAFHYGLKSGARPSGYRGKGIPSIHMPRWASRLTLIVEGVKVERLQDISEADAVAEGIVRIGVDYGAGMRPTSFDNGPNLYTVNIDGGSHSAPSAAEVYHMLWQHLHGDGSWDANPWVVAVTFRVERGNIDRLPQ